MGQLNEMLKSTDSMQRQDRVKFGGLGMMGDAKPITPSPLSTSSERHTAR